MIVIQRIDYKNFPKIPNLVSFCENFDKLGINSQKRSQMMMAKNVQEALDYQETGVNQDSDSMNSFTLVILI